MKLYLQTEQIKQETPQARCLTSYEACPEGKDTKALNMYNIFNLKRDTVNKLPVHNFIFQHTSSHRHCPNIY